MQIRRFQFISVILDQLEHIFIVLHLIRQSNRDSLIYYSIAEYFALFLSLGLQNIHIDIADSLFHDLVKHLIILIINDQSILHVESLQSTDIQVEFGILLRNHVVRVDSINLNIGSRNVITN